MDEFQDLLSDLQTVPEVASLPDLKQQQLAVLILEKLASNRANEGVRGVWHPVVGVSGDIEGQVNVTPRGRPQKLESARFLEDCVNAWEAVSGARVEVWYNDAHDCPSVTMKIVDAALSGQPGWVGVQGLKKRARKAASMRRNAAKSQA